MTWKTAIEHEMKALNMRKATLAKLSGLSKGYITDLLHDDESKRKTKPTLDSVEKIARVFKLTGWQLWRKAGKADGKGE